VHEQDFHGRKGPGSPCGDAGFMDADHSR
jgi:hypothetical protein